jgi:hypothetical protein
MNMAATIRLYGGGPGSGCEGPNCGRPPLSAWVKNTKAFKEPPRVSRQGFMDHYVVEPDGTAKLVPSHITYFSQSNKGFNQFMREGGITVTVSSGGPGISFGRSDEETIEKVLQVAREPVFREHGATVEYYDPDTKDRKSFDGSPVQLRRAMDAWVTRTKSLKGMRFHVRNRTNYLS